MLVDPATPLRVLSITASLQVVGDIAGLCVPGSVSYIKPQSVLVITGLFLFLFCFFCRGSIDCIQLINEEHMVSGADDG